MPRRFPTYIPHANYFKFKFEINFGDMRRWTKIAAPEISTDKEKRSRGHVILIVHRLISPLDEKSLLSCLTHTIFCNDSENTLLQVVNNERYDHGSIRSQHLPPSGDSSFLPRTLSSQGVESSALLVDAFVGCATATGSSLAVGVRGFLLFFFFLHAPCTNTRCRLVGGR